MGSACFEVLHFEGLLGANHLLASAQRISFTYSQPRVAPFLLPHQSLSTGRNEVIQPEFNCEARQRATGCGQRMT